MTNGYKTTEFWLTLANTVLMVLVATGIIGPDERDEIAGLVAPLAGALIPIAFYIWSRTKVKEAVASGDSIREAISSGNPLKFDAH